LTFPFFQDLQTSQEPEVRRVKPSDSSDFGFSTMLGCFFQDLPASSGWWFQTFGLFSIIKKGIMGCHPSH
jgi:hypothetical protein